MRIPRIVNVFERGLYALRKSISLATKGILDQTLPKGTTGGRVTGIDIIWKIVGTKKFELIQNYKVKGIVSRIINFLYKILGIKQFSIDFNYAVNAVVASKLKLVLRTKGIKQFNISEHNRLIGIVSRPLVYDTRLIGNKRFNIIINANIKGTKQSRFDNSFAIKAKKDITTILVALGILGDNNE